ncbi:NACHT domain-containing protein [Streptomyces europaeiscabiei]|uniref:NACHT domain-containing protein n=1 Tax=Streptomyces europaeiscabiei TaxID=146819 RepID=UPI0029AEECD4|nr:TIR domain-containing protein [Streptomyces europaeiscabiei]MDX3611311.1 TIR domain-containing protein [Streptomyces europaeiscabiei]
MPRIFINYRTGDGDFAAALLDLQLSVVFGEDNVFLASRTIGVGEDFESEILGRLRECSLVLALVGGRWLDARTADGRRRIDLDSDWVRRELVEAQRLGITVVPVLLDHAGRLDPDSLPAELASFARAQYRRMRHRHARDDIARLVSDVRELDTKLVTVEEADLRAYVAAVAASLGRTQGWLPYADLDLGFLDRSVTVGDAPADKPLDGATYQEGHGDDALPRGDVGWARAIQDVPVAVLLADAGYGKTWLLRHQGIRVCQDAVSALDEGADPERIAVPLWVHADRLARHWQRGVPEREALVSAALEELRLAPASHSSIRRFLTRRLDPAMPSVHVFVDAYDEVFDDTLRDALGEALRWMAGLVRADSGARILLSSRPAGFASPFIGLPGTTADDAAQPRFLYLGVLEEQQIRRLWERWYDARGRDAVPGARLDPVLAPGSAIRRYAGVPLIAAFCAWVAEDDQVAPHRSGLYGQVVDKFFALPWKDRAAPGVGSPRTDPALRHRTSRALEELGWRMAVSGPHWRDAIDVVHADDILTEAFGPALASGDRSRSFEAVRHLGILAQPGLADNVEPAPLTWVHRSIHQFMVARRLVTMPPAETCSLVEERCWLRPEWADVLDFAIGLESDRAPTEARPVTAAVRRLALGDTDGLGWFATLFVSAAAGLTEGDTGRQTVVEKVWALHRAGFLSATHLARVLALTPEGDPERIVRLVLDSADGQPDHETWEALSWCGHAGTSALAGIVSDPAAPCDGAAIALYRVRPDAAVAALTRRLRTDPTLSALDAPVLRDAVTLEVDRLLGAYRADSTDVRRARALGWTRHRSARTELLARLTAPGTTAEERCAAVAGTAAAYGNDLDEASCATLLEIALHDPDPDVRVRARGELRVISLSVPWVEERLAARHEELFRDDSAPELNDLVALAARLEEIGPATVTAVVMLQEAPQLTRVEPVATAMLTLTMKALTGVLDVELTRHVAEAVGPSFVELACERLVEGGPGMSREAYTRLAAAMCLAARENATVFSALAAGAARRPGASLARILVAHDLSPEDKAAVLRRSLGELRSPNRQAVQTWTAALRQALLSMPAEDRDTLRGPVSALTRRVLAFAEEPDTTPDQK